MTDHVLIQHIHDEDAGVYRLYYGVPVLVAVPTGLLNTEGQPITRLKVTAHTHPCDVVFSDSDPRWLAADGTRRPAEKVKAMQWQLVQDALNARTTPA
jgi:hypothetical protein